MMKRTMATALAVLGGIVITGSLASPSFADDHGKRHDQREIRKDYHDVAKAKRDLHQEARRGGNTSDERKKLHDAVQDLHKEQRDYQRDHGHSYSAPGNRYGQSNNNRNWNNRNDHHDDHHNRNWHR